MTKRKLFRAQIPNVFLKCEITYCPSRARGTPSDESVTLKEETGAVGKVERQEAAAASGASSVLPGREIEKFF
jgi:hypothetical protein